LSEQEEFRAGSQSEQTESTQKALLSPPTTDSEPSSHYPTPRKIEQKNDRVSRESMELLLNSVVYIRGETNLGTGFLVSSDGYIISNKHVTSSMQNPTIITRDGQQFKARKVSEDSDVDLSLIKIDVRNAPFLEMGDANTLYPGQEVITIGNPSG